MADLPLTALPVAVTANPVDLLYTVQGGQSRQVAVQHVAGVGLRLNTRDIAANTALALTDGVLYCSPPVGGLTVSLLPSATARPRAFYIRNLDTTGRLVTLLPDGLETIEGLASFTVYATEVVAIHATTTDWRVISE